MNQIFWKRILLSTVVLLRNFRHSPQFTFLWFWKINWWNLCILQVNKQYYFLCTFCVPLQEKMRERKRGENRRPFEVYSNRQSVDSSKQNGNCLMVPNLVSQQKMHANIKQEIILSSLFLFRFWIIPYRIAPLCFTFMFYISLSWLIFFVAVRFSCRCVFLWLQCIENTVWTTSKIVKNQNQYVNKHWIWNTFSYQM